MSGFSAENLILQGYAVTEPGQSIIGQGLGAQSSIRKSLPTDELCKRIAGFLREVPGVTKAVDRPGGVFSWVEKPRPGTSFWEVDFSAADADESFGIGRQLFEFTTVKISGYMPFSFDNPNSAKQWRDLVDLVRRKLLENRTAECGANDVSPPRIIVNDLGNISPGGRGPSEVLCHHVQIELRVRFFVTYNTA